MIKPFIITLTGPSACGKGLITEAIIEYSSRGTLPEIIRNQIQGIFGINS